MRYKTGAHLAVIITALLALLPCARAAAASDTTNMTKSNKSAVAAAVLRLQQTELTRISRGRLKLNPVLYSHHETYQNILMNHGLMVDRITGRYANSLAMLTDLFSDYAAFPQAGDLHGDSLFFKRRLIDIYDLAAEAEAAESLLELSRHVNSAGMNMQALPVRARLFLNTKKWLRAYYGDMPVPPGVRARLDELRGRESPLLNPFDLEAYVHELSADYARLLAAVVEGRDIMLHGPEATVPGGEAPAPGEDTGGAE